MSDLAERFSLVQIDGETCEGCGGWGQFLDADRENRQIGPYGTSAGFIVFGLAGRDARGPSAAPLSLLRHWWDRREDDCQQRFSQTLRVAFLMLALQVATGDAVEAFRTEVWAELKRRRLPSGLWGRWWLSEERHDARGDLFVTALVVLAATYRRDAAEYAFLSESLAALKSGFPSQPSHSFQQVAIGAALAVAGGPHPRRVDQALTRIALGRSFESSDTPVFFFDYEYSDQETGATVYARDYFIVPVDALLVLAAFHGLGQRRLKAWASERAEGLIRLMSQGFFRSGGSKRASTKDQAWIALGLSAYGQAPRRHWLPRGAGRIGFALDRKVQHLSRRWSPYPQLALASLVVFLGNVLSSEGSPVVQIGLVAVLLFVTDRLLPRGDSR